MSDAVTPGEGRSSPTEAAVRRRARLSREAEDAKRIRDLVTPEGAALKLRIASGSERAGAFIIDFLIQIAVIIIGVMAIGFTFARLGITGMNVGFALIMVFVFVLRNFYFIAFEIGRRAATPGKRLLGLRVASRDGGRLNANAVFARNFMRELEVFLPLSFMMMGGDRASALIGLAGFAWTAVFLFFPLFNKDKLRVGDLVAGTWVIHAPKTKLLRDIATSGPTSTDGLGGFTFTPEQAEAYGIHELHVLENVLRNSTADVRAAVAERIRGKIGWQRGPAENDRAFLEAYYAALRRRLEQRMLFGDRKEDKFDD
ncbi:MAG: RDD family protein [Pseudomonadota bacterium]